ncbi:minor tail protein [Mycobacterium phage Purky]|uniref:DUF7572 domain-containing protein n=1 Tax=Mycobacterium phage Purky TaxID=2593351 RepID=A0A514TWR1_9CAUD|nr:minor tail protein [Mycobacterium phage Purky]QDK01127.1 hypothetical protein SEA_PURKY_21 [Mycobacterium phage Purky]
MAYAELLDTDMSTWCPITLHYKVTDGDQVSYLAVTRVSFVTATGRVEAFACDETGLATSLAPLWAIDGDVGHNDALVAAGFTVL